MQRTKRIPHIVPNFLLNRSSLPHLSVHRFLQHPKSHSEKNGIRGRFERRRHLVLESLNLGVPANTNVRVLNGKGADFIDRGLAEAPSFAGQVSAAGRFRVPTLRNVAVTAPYMHNGVFQELRTAVLFHDRFKAAAGTNPETFAPWGPPEVDANLATHDLGGPALTELQLSAIIAFLATLTDKRYEHLPPQP